MKNFVLNELACLRAMEPIGSDRYNELSDAICWVQKQELNTENEKQEQKHNFAHTKVMFKKTGETKDVIFKLSKVIEQDDKGIFFYCDGEEDYKKLISCNNGQDFAIVGCTLYTETL